MLSVTPYLDRGLAVIGAVSTAILPELVLHDVVPAWVAATIGLGIGAAVAAWHGAGTVAQVISGKTSVKVTPSTLVPVNVDPATAGLYATQTGAPVPAAVTPTPPTA